MIVLHSFFFFTTGYSYCHLIFLGLSFYHPTMDQSVSVVASPLQHPAGYQSQTQQQQLFVLAYADEVVFDWSRSLLIC